VTAPHSLRRLLVGGASAVVAAVAVVMVAVIVLFASVKRTFERDIRAGLVEQHAADEIVTTVYGQLLAAYRQLQAPSDRNRRRFDLLDSIAYTGLRQYLFQPMPAESRLQVEAIKELHQQLEVDAHHAFTLMARGDNDAARARIAAMEAGVAALVTAMDNFRMRRERDRAAMHARQAQLLQRLLIGITAIVIGLVAFAILFVRVVRRRVVLPLGQLSAAAARLGRGDLTARIREQSDEELAGVAISFNEMADRVQDAHMEVERRNAELNAALLDLKRAQQELVQQETLGAIGFMLAGLAHELNNPLAGILGSAQLLQDELEDHPDPSVRKVADELVTPLVTEARRAGNLVRNLLQFSRETAGRPEPVNLKTAIDIAAGLRSFAFAQAGKALHVDVPDSLFVAVDVQRLEHVAMNIMTNALDAMRGEGGTRLTVRATAIDPEWVSLTFEDDGPGFREPERVFNAFYTTKAVGAGTGLGLTLVHRFVEEAGGTVTASNVPSGGARLTIRLRAAAPPPVPDAIVPAEAPRQAASDALPGNADHTALIVEDEPALRNIQKRFLARLGIRVLVATNGAEAIETLQREPCDVVITDLRMPGEPDGIGLYKWIEREQPWLASRCLFVTGDIGEWAPDSVIGAHPERVLNKPFNRDDYLAHVRALIEKVPAMPA
jgi:signal transduction histidine kinase/ActR/RegA family two-component response regulator